MNILESFRIEYPLKLAAVGAGGKSSFLFALASEISGKCIVTTTTHISIEQSYAGDLRLLANDSDLFDKIKSAPDGALIIVIGTEQGRERVNGPDPIILSKLSSLCDEHNISILIEADGSKRLPIKAFDDHEPLVPEWVDTVVHIIGWNGIGKAVSTDTIFRVDRYCKLTDAKNGDTITFSSITKMLLHQDGGKKPLQSHQRSIIFFNQCPEYLNIDEDTQRNIYGLLTFHHSVLFGNTFSSSTKTGKIFACFENLAAVVLAAGGATRLGENNIKQLLQYKGKSFIQNTVELLNNGLFSKIFAVVGYEYEKVKKDLIGYPVEIIHNPHWANGQSTSVLSAVRELMKLQHYGGAIFLPIDQPFLDTETINQIVGCHTENIGKAIVPRYDDTAGSPVLFDRNQFENLLGLHGDKGGRSILHQVPKQFCEISNPLAMHDIDTMDAYIKLIQDTD